MTPVQIMLFATAALERLRIEYYITGSMASSSWGEARSTLDADIVVLLSEHQAARLCDAFPEDEFYVSREAAIDAARRGSGQFNAIHPTSGFKIDFMVAGGSATEEARFDRARTLKVTAEATARFAAPEDVILSKLQFYREGRSDKHISDIRGILRVSGPDLDFEYLDRWAGRLGVQEEWRMVRGK